ncbi:hypothetical protein GS682_04900 [Nostoc sp. B(2019)]|nr:hypothetical protein [Nostoc sp. B(2019)]
MSSTESALIQDLTGFDVSVLIPQLQSSAAVLTRAFVSFCQSVYVARLTSDRPEWRETKESMGWAGSTATPYVHVGEWLGEIDPSNLELLDIKTIMALCNNKYLSIIERLKSDRLTVAEVREEMKAINKETKKPKEPPKVLEWKQSKRGDRFCIIRLEDPLAGAEFENHLKSSRQPLPLFIRSLLQRNTAPDTCLEKFGETETIAPNQFAQVMEPAQGVSPTFSWQQAQNELAIHIEEQSYEIDEVQQIQKDICNCDRIIAQYAGSNNPSERMMWRVSLEEKAKHQYRLEQLGALQLAA